MKRVLDPVIPSSRYACVFIPRSVGVLSSPPPSLAVETSRSSALNVLFTSSLHKGKERERESPFNCSSHCSVEGRESSATALPLWKAAARGCTAGRAGPSARRRRAVVRDGAALALKSGVSGQRKRQLTYSTAAAARKRKEGREGEKKQHSVSLRSKEGGGDIAAACCGGGRRRCKKSCLVWWLIGAVGTRQLVGIRVRRAPDPALRLRKVR